MCRINFLIKCLHCTNAISVNKCHLKTYILTYRFITLWAIFFRNRAWYRKAIRPLTINFHWLLFVTVTVFVFLRNVVSSFFLCFFLNPQKSIKTNYVCKVLPTTKITSFSDEDASDHMSMLMLVSDASSWIGGLTFERVLYLPRLFTFRPRTYN